jgi:uncharacterized protein (TIGR00255 family)
MSMTGFGRGSAPCDRGTLVVELRTVNHRFLEVRCRVPAELLAAESLLDRLLRRTVRRGYCTVHLSWEGAGVGAARIDEEALDARLEQLIRVGARHGLCLADLIPVLSSAPGLYTPPLSVPPGELTAAVTAAFDAAAAGLVEMRREEGRATAEAMADLLQRVRDTVERLAVLAAGQASTVLGRSRERIAALLAETDLALDPRRVEAEAALLADRADVNEEIVRLRSHCGQQGDLLLADEPVGRKLEFLVQEMLREANTLGSKAGLVELTREVLELKALLEKQRELAQNVE